MAPMLGWSNALAARASRRKRALAVSSAASGQPLLQPIIGNDASEERVRGATKGWANRQIGALCAFALLASQRLRGQLDRRALQETSRPFLRCQQRADFALQLGVSPAGAPQEFSALSGRVLQRQLEQAINLFESIRFHRRPRCSFPDRAKPSPCSSRASR